MYTGEFLRMFSAGSDDDMSMIDGLEPRMKSGTVDYMMKQCFGAPLMNTNPTVVDSYDPEHTTDTQIDEGLKLTQNNNLKGTLTIIKHTVTGRIPVDDDLQGCHVMPFTTETSGPNKGQLVFFNPRQSEEYVEGTGLYYVDANSKTWTKRALLDELPTTSGARRPDSWKVYQLLIYNSKSETN
jgi:hypothetical protein